MRYAIEILKGMKAHLLAVLEGFKPTQHIEEKRKCLEKIKQLEKAIKVLENRNIQNNLFE